MVRFIFCVLILLITFSSPIFGQSYFEPAFYTLNTENGLLSNRVYHTIQDRKGLVWFATERGLSSYDGYSFHHYIVTDSRFHNDILSLHEDHLGRIWFLDYSLHLGFIDNGKLFTNITMPWIPDLKNYSLTMANDSQKTFLVGEEGYWEVFKDSVSFHPLHTQHPRSCILDNDLKIFTKNVIYDIDINDHTAIKEYLALENTGLTLAKVRSEHYYNGLSGSIVKLEDSSTKFDLNLFNSHDRLKFSYLQNHDHKVYGVYGHQLFVIMNDSITNYLFENYYSLTSLLVTPGGSIFISTAKHGVLFIPHELLNTNRLHKNNNIENHYEGLFITDNIIWTSTRGHYVHGVNFNTKDKIQGEFSRLSPIKVIRDVEAYQDNIYLVGSDEVVKFKFDPNGEGLNRIEEIPIGSKNIKAFEIIDGSRIMLGFSNGCLILDKKNELVLNNIRTYSICKIEDNIWISQRDGLRRFNIRTNSLEYIANIPMKKIFKHTNSNYRIILTETQELVLLNLTDNSFVKLSGSAQKIWNAQFIDGYLYFQNNNQIVKCTINETTKKLNIINSYSFYSSKNNLGPKSFIINKDCIYISTGAQIYSVSLKDIFPSNTKKKTLYAFSSTTYLSNNELISLNKHTHALNILVIDPDLELDSITYIYDGLSNASLTNKFMQFVQNEGSHQLTIEAKTRFGKNYNNLDYQIDKKLPFTSSRLFRYLTLAFIVTALVGIPFLMYRYDNKQKSLRYKMEQRENNLRLFALRSQMNPHFVHNSLNSILALMLDNKVEDATNSMSWFSDMFRSFLHSTNHNMHSISQEVNMLEKYIKLESLRFNQTFSYNINVAASLYSKMIPTALIQPLVENAVWHGLLPDTLNLKKELHINFRVENNTLLIEVDDNGVGIISRDNDQSKDSIALKNIYERITLINLGKRFEIGFTIVNKSTIDKKSKGTLCTLKIKDKIITK